jgi:hypothetical protein
MDLDADMLEFFRRNQQNRSRIVMPEFKVITEHRAIDTFTRRPADDVIQDQQRKKRKVPAGLTINDVIDNSAYASEQKPVTVHGTGFTPNSTGIVFQDPVSLGLYEGTETYSPPSSNGTLIYTKTPSFPPVTGTGPKDYKVAANPRNTSNLVFWPDHFFHVYPDSSGGGGGGPAPDSFQVNPDGFVTLNSNIPIQVQVNVIKAGVLMTTFNGPLDIYFGNPVFNCSVLLYQAGSTVISYPAYPGWGKSGTVTVVNGTITFSIVAAAYSVAGGSFQMEVKDPNSTTFYDTFNYNVY